MEIELREVRDFIAQRPPFNTLTDDALDSLPRQVTIRYLRRGSVFPPAAEASLYLVRTGAIELRDDKDNLVGMLGENDIHVCQQNQLADITGHAREDCLLYAIPCTVIDSLSSRFESFAHYFEDSIQKRLQHAVATRQSSMQAYSAMTLEAGKLTDRQPVMIEAESSIQQAAQIMSDENVSSILIMENEILTGVVTDRDIRKRCIAGNISRQQPISSIMSANPVTIEPHTTLSTALLKMTRHQIHHLPVMQNSKPVGNLSLSDVVRHLGTNPAFVASDIYKANSIEALAKVSQRLPELQLHLANANSTAAQIGEVISSIGDSLCQRLLQLAEAEFGPPPVPYVWVAAGSQARNEQTCHSDQDNAIIIDNSMQDGHISYFEKLTAFVSDGLNSCGYKYCPGNAMATNPQWQQTLDDWKNTFRNWIEKPERMALMLSSIFFDMRPVYGETQLFADLQSSIHKLTKTNGIFIAYMVANALSHKPPLGFFRNFVLVHDGEHDNTLDIKHRGLAPIVDIARIYALNLGIGTANTNERLQQASELGSLGREMCANLIDAFEFISTLRIQHQASKIRNGEPLDNYLSPSMLSGLERGHLKDAFSVIKDMQEVLENRYQSARLS